LSGLAKVFILRDVAVWHKGCDKVGSAVNYRLRSAIQRKGKIELTKLVNALKGMFFDRNLSGSIAKMQGVCVSVINSKPDKNQDVLFALPVFQSSRPKS
jgi:hypothetical protein